jgi:hypothetical protein
MRENAPIYIIQSNYTIKFNLIDFSATLQQQKNAAAGLDLDYLIHQATGGVTNVRHDRHLV